MWTQRSRNCIRTKLSISIIEQVETESGFILLFRIFVCVTQMWGEKSVLGMNQASVMQHIYLSREKKHFINMKTLNSYGEMFRL